jgi:mRNA interferase RelE/StbE
VSGELEEGPYELRTTSAVRHALSKTRPEAVAAAAYEFITGPLLADPHRIGKRLLPPMDDRFSARRGTYRVIYPIDDKDPRTDGRRRGPPSRCLPHLSSGGARAWPNNP